MALSRYGYAGSILHEILQDSILREISQKDKSDLFIQNFDISETPDSERLFINPENSFLADAENFGIAPAVIEITAQLMRERHDTSEEAAQVLCILIGTLLNGHATVCEDQLDALIGSWCMNCKKDSVRLRQWLDDNKCSNQYIHGVNYSAEMDKNCGKDDKKYALNYYKDKKIYTLPRFAEMQLKLDNVLKSWIVSKSESLGTNDLDAFIRTIEQIDDDQKKAVRSFGAHRMTVVAGGPGTGKTSCVICQILRYSIEQLHYSDADIILAAPTGKAAQRMLEAIQNTFENSSAKLREMISRLSAKTLHRVLGIRPDSSGGVRLDTQKLIIVDEVSMVDLSQAYELFKSIEKNNDVKIVLVGDPNQLPPVNAGDILSHLKNLAQKQNAGFGYTELTHNHRTDCRDIAHLQNAVISGRLIQKITAQDKRMIIDDIKTTLTDESHRIEILCTSIKDSDELPFKDYYYIDNISSTGLILDRWCGKMKSGCKFKDGGKFEEIIAKIGDPNKFGAVDDDLFKSFYTYIDSKFRILTAVNDGIYGTTKINRVICDKLGLKKGTFPPGALVMLTRNNYRIGHFNGETGMIIKLGHDHPEYPDIVCAAFPKSDSAGSFDYYPLDMLSDTLTLAFAITIHKSQGSEYTHGLIILPAKKSMLLTRNLLYTAISRTRESVTIIARDEIFESCIEQEVIHDTWISD